MKKILFAAIVTGVSVFSLSAHAEGSYAGIAIEKTNSTIDLPGVNVTSNSKPTGFKLYGGYDFTPNLAIEAGYADFGTAKADFNVGASSGKVEAKLSSFYVAGKGTVQFNQQFSGFGKLGVARNKADATATGAGITANASGNETALYAAVGVAYHFTKNVAATLEYESFGKSSGNVGKANAISLGARFSF